jgi:hypothetical protein
VTLPLDSRKDVDRQAGLYRGRMDDAAAGAAKQNQHRDSTDPFRRH